MTRRFIPTVLLLLAATTAGAALPALDDQYGEPGSLEDFSGQAVLVIVTSPRKLRWIGRWEAALRKEIPRLNSVRIADINEEPPPDPERVAEVLRKRVPPGVSILIDLDSEWAAHYQLDTGEPCLVLLDPGHREVARFRGRPKGKLVDEVLTALRDYFPTQADS